MEFVNCVLNVTDYGGTPPYGNPCCMGCLGGDYDASFKWLKEENKNLILANDWKYTAVQDIREPPGCDYETKDHTRVTVADYTDVIANSSSSLMAAVAQQPVGVSVDAEYFKLYVHGILDDADCFTVTNHGVTVVGYGTRESDAMKYWIIKNSWGTSYGENGYIRVKNTGEDGPGMCGINMFPSFATTTTNLQYTK